MKTADTWRNRGQTYEEQQDLQNAFVAYASAGKLALEVIAVHPDYDRTLSEEQKLSLAKVSVPARFLRQPGYGRLIYFIITVF